jgi:hypothetical protein
MRDRFLLHGGVHHHPLEIFGLDRSTPVGHREALLPQRSDLLLTQPLTPAGYGSRAVSEQRCLLFYWDSDIGRSVPKLDLEKPVSIISTDEGVRQSGRRVRARARELQF